MRIYSVPALAGSDNANLTGNALDASQILSASFLANFGDLTGVGTLQLQGSNDAPLLNSGAFNSNTITNWINIPNSGIQIGSATISAGANALLQLPQNNFLALRLLFTPGAGVQTIAPIADVSGSLAGCYFLLQDANGVHKYAVWLKVSGVGTGPSIVGYTNEEVDISNNDTAGTIGAALATKIAALNSTNSFTATGTTLITVTNKVVGPLIPIVDGTAPLNTTFTFAVSAGGTSTVAVNMGALYV